MRAGQGFVYGVQVKSGVPPFLAGFSSQAAYIRMVNGELTAEDLPGILFAGALAGGSSRAIDMIKDPFYRVLAEFGAMVASSGLMLGLEDVQYAIANPVTLVLCPDVLAQFMYELENFSSQWNSQECSWSD